ncbi:hypothetical protein CRYUN_Cryun03dG0015900 [Craigia yunnanensis]
MKLAGLKSVENAHDESVWTATWVAATDTRLALLLTGSLDETVKLWRPDERAGADQHRPLRRRRFCGFPSFRCDRCLRLARQLGPRV